MMRKLHVFALLTALPFGVIALGRSVGFARDVDDDGESIRAEVVASGIPGAAAIAQIGTFHTGGPFHDRADFAAFTEPGRVLHRTRLFVTSTWNFGAPLARPSEAAGSILSLDVSHGPVAVPSDFAISGGQASAEGGRVILYTAQSPDFLNSINNPNAVTGDRPAVSLPLGISFNNGFGRPWFANAPTGGMGDGTITVVDPQGVPLAGAPDATAGGVFAGSLTNRVPGSPGGLTSAAVATALATKSPDLGIRAVFFAALADGSIAQVHVEKGVDDLVPAGSFTPISDISPETVESTHPRIVTRVGMAFNWVPTRILYVTDPLANRILALDINGEDTDPQLVFTATNLRYFRSHNFDEPIDLAPAVPEVSARNFASNTTLGGGSDFYVLNRGNNSIVRMRQNGTVVAVRHIRAPVLGFRVQGLAVSEDARLIWVTATAPHRQGVVLQMPTFRAGRVTTSMIDHARDAGANGAVAQGRDVFVNELGPEQRLGPLFNGRSCNNCHNTVGGNPIPGGMGISPDTFITRVAHVEDGILDPLLGRGGPVARQRSIMEFGIPCDLPTGIPPEANATSPRSAMTLRGTSLLDNIRITDLEKVRLLQPPSVQGRLNRLADGRVGRFGWKAQTATLVEFMAEAFRDEIGMTNPLAPADLVNGCGTTVRPEADAVPLTSLVAFLNTIDPPVPGAACVTSLGAGIFAEQTDGGIGCATCHRPTMFGPGNSGTNPTTIRPYTDLLLHDMGPGLADGFPQGSATASEFRTAPLWAVSDRLHFLHDGRASSLRDAIEAHGGQAGGAVDRFHALTAVEQQALLDFLSCI